MATKNLGPIIVKGARRVIYSIVDQSQLMMMKLELIKLLNAAIRIIKRFVFVLFDLIQHWSANRVNYSTLIKISLISTTTNNRHINLAHHTFEAFIVTTCYFDLVRQAQLNFKN
jgi:hypothetical protein